METHISMPVKLDRILRDRMHTLTLKQMIRYQRAHERRVHE